MKNFGFTLLELMVSIAVIGVLAAVILVAVNPAEKINQAKDSAILTETAQLFQAATIAYEANGEVPIPCSGTQGQQGLVTNGVLQNIFVSNQANGGPVYNTSTGSGGCVGNGVTAANDFQTQTNTLLSKSSMKQAEQYAVNDLSSSACTVASVQTNNFTHVYAYWKNSLGSTIHYGCW